MELRKYPCQGRLTRTEETCRPSFIIFGELCFLGEQRFHPAGGYFHPAGLDGLSLRGDACPRGPAPEGAGEGTTDADRIWPVWLGHDVYSSGGQGAARQDEGERRKVTDTRGLLTNRFNICKRKP